MFLAWIMAHCCQSVLVVNLICFANQVDEALTRCSKDDEEELEVFRAKTLLMLEDLVQLIKEAQTCFSNFPQISYSTINSLIVQLVN